MTSEIFCTISLLRCNLSVISMQCYYISMQLIGWSFYYISSRALLHFYAAHLLHFYAKFIIFLCSYYISMQAYYISMQLLHFYAIITFLCPALVPWSISLYFPKTLHFLRCVRTLPCGPHPLSHSYFTDCSSSFVPYFILFIFSFSGTRILLVVIWGTR